MPKKPKKQTKLPSLLLKGINTTTVFHKRCQTSTRVQGCIIRNISRTNSKKNLELEEIFLKCQLVKNQIQTRQPSINIIGQYRPLPPPPPPPPSLLTVPDQPWPGGGRGRVVILPHWSFHWSMLHSFSEGGREGHPAWGERGCRCMVTLSRVVVGEEGVWSVGSWTLSPRYPHPCGQRDTYVWNNMFPRTTWSAIKNSSEKIRNFGLWKERGKFPAESYVVKGAISCMCTMSFFSYKSSRGVRDFPSYDPVTWEWVAPDRYWLR